MKLSYKWLLLPLERRKIGGTIFASNAMVCDQQKHSWAIYVVEGAGGAIYLAQADRSLKRNPRESSSSVLIDVLCPLQLQSAANLLKSSCVMPRQW